MDIKWQFVLRFDAKTYVTELLPRNPIGDNLAAVSAIAPVPLELPLLCFCERRVVQLGSAARLRGSLIVRLEG